MRASWRPARNGLLAAAAGAVALAGGVLLPAAASAQSAGTPATTTITLGLSPATVDYGHQNVTASGTVTTTAGPVAGATVTVSYVDIDQQFAQISLTTGTDGSYSGIIPDPETAAQTITARRGHLEHDRRVGVTAARLHHGRGDHYRQLRSAIRERRLD